MREKSLTRIAREQLQNGGLTILDADLLYQAEPTQWASRQEALMQAERPAKILGTLRVSHPRAICFEADIGGAATLGIARSLIDIERRVEALTGLFCKAVKEIDPGSVRHQETSRVTAIRQVEADEFDGFAPASFTRTLPRWPCANRADGLAKLERYWTRHPGQYDATAYLDEERERRASFEASLPNKAAEEKH